MIICDLCNKECLDDRKVTIHYEFSCKAYQSKEVHMCGCCREELKNARLLADVEFYDRKIAHRGEVKKTFTPEEVRNMSRSEVRENYTAIMDSMKEWN